MKILFTIMLGLLSVHASQQPNIVLVIADDQGYGDLGYTGNPVIQTPNIDELIKESVWLEDYHVGPSCSPTRCSLLTGHWTNRTGVWHTINGRSMLRENEVTLADYLANAGYETGIFGKWHLGDNYPYRPEDRGFTYTYYHGAGGIGQTPDLWNNDYFDDRYHHNGEVVQAEGYCTDVFFSEARKFVKQSVDAHKPFFAYISTTAPHTPLSVPQEYMDRYVGKDGVSDKVAAFYGMISNIDENVGVFRNFLKDLGVDRDTIFIYTTDNGTATGDEFYNAQMRGKKCSEYEGGHRVPFALRWPEYGIDQHKTITELTHMVDIVPTLLQFCGVETDGSTSFDGVSLDGLMTDAAEAQGVDWQKRVVISDSQRVKDPVKWKQSATMSGKWRLINGKELYNVSKDPSQKVNVIKKHPKVAKRLKQFYEEWWAELEPTFSQTTEIYIGATECPEVILTAHDWIQRKYPPWNQSQMRSAYDAKPGNKFVGHWAVKVVKSGQYKVSVSRWPFDSGLAITAGTPAMPVVPGFGANYSATKGRGLPVKQAMLKIDGEQKGSQAVSEDTKVVSFTVELTEGSHQLAPYFVLGGEKLNESEVGAYFCKVEPVE